MIHVCWREHFQLTRGEVQAVHVLHPLPELTELGHRAVDAVIVHPQPNQVVEACHAWRQFPLQQVLAQSEHP